MTASAPETHPQGYVPPAPNPIQQLLLDVPANDFVHLGTGKGVGKSFGILFRVARDHQLYKDKANTLIVRSTFQSLQEIQSILYKHLIHWFPKTTWSSGENLFKLGGKQRTPGERSSWPYSATSPTEQIRSLARLQGRSKTLLILDECGVLPTREFVDGLMGVLRAEPGQPTAAVFLIEPRWCRTSLVEADLRYPCGAISGGPGEHMKPQRFWSEEFQRFCVHCTANASINPHLDWQAYKRSVELMAGGDPALMAALLEGSWDIDAGGSFFAPPTWSTKRCRKPIERGSIDLVKEKCFLSFDWGVGAPSRLRLDVAESTWLHRWGQLY